MPSLRYRSDIDGIRALAVLGVIIYHAFPAVLPGGFTGVDIFFVISGYLISGILYVGNFDGSFRYQEFYSRRIRRLFPALLIVLPLCMAYGWRVMLPREFRILGEHVAAGGLFAQNIVFWRESGYFNESSELNPLLHLWSLAVEEQFYFFFPLIILLLLKRKSLLLPAIIVLIAISFIANLIISISHPSADFYLTPFRVWEFLAGCLLAWCHFIRGDKEGCLYHQEIISWAGFLIIFFSMALLKEQQSYPGWRALLPVAGTLALLNSGKKSETPWINRKILSNPAIVWIGLISYPLYLFHWPALSFLKIITPPSLHPDKWLIWCALGV
jgi:peptidoglycan/LPS O-acetylase OafA/YrhL